MKKLEITAIIASWLFEALLVFGSVIDRIDTGYRGFVPTEADTIAAVWIIVTISLNIMLMAGPGRKISFDRALDIISNLAKKCILFYARIMGVPFTEEDMSGKLNVKKLAKRAVVSILFLMIPGILTILIFYFFKK